MANHLITNFLKPGVINSEQDGQHRGVYPIIPLFCRTPTTPAAFSKPSQVFFLTCCFKQLTQEGNKMWKVSGIKEGRTTKNVYRKETE
ncbi:hypothetical protein RRG08_030178 [Elysia crispata]|uniref:Uncharacterized protein n=1 Tax=Elysia crispata TaxID=231223 RepID=A0AAE0ZS90_9GAST|nr:hypothetical protein RRG08_030178 [Elysia crispata]